MRLQGKRAVVTGGANGIGRATAERFAREGAHVVIADRNREAGAAAVEAIRVAGGKAEFVVAEMTDEAAVSGLFTQADSFLGGIDVLVSNAGWSLTEDLLDIEPDAWHKD